MAAKRIYVTSAGRSTITWRGRYRDASGRECSRAFARKSDAEAWERERAAAVRVSGGRTSVEVYASRWRAHQVQHREGTATRVESVMRLHILPALGRLPVAAVTRSHVSELVTRWSASSAPRTVRQRYAFLAAMFGAAELDGLIAASPCRRVRLPTVEAELIRPLTPAQVRDLADAVPGHVRPVVLAGAGLGVRVSEALALSADRVDVARREVLVDRQQSPRPPYEPRPLKNSRSTPFRAVPCPEPLLEEFARLAAPGSPARLFAGRDGGPLTARAVSRAVSRAVAAAGLPSHTSFHDLRHFYASALVDGGESVAVVAARLGDTPVEVLRTYAHLFDGAQDRTREIVAAALRVPQRE